MGSLKIAEKQMSLLCSIQEKGGGSETDNELMWDLEIRAGEEGLNN